MSNYVKRYEDWPRKKFCVVRQNAEGEYDVVGVARGTVVYTSPFEEAAQAQADVRNRYANHQLWLKQVPYPLPPDHFD